MEAAQLAAPVTSPSSMSPEELAQLTDGIVAALKTVYDPEIPADIYELGYCNQRRKIPKGRLKKMVCLLLDRC